jgi:hypothetical protein
MSEQFNMDERDNMILSNFASINKQIQFWPGNVLTSAAHTGKLLARANTKMSIPRTFAIDNLGQLLNAISLFSEPKIVIKDNCLSIQDDRHKMRYTFTDTENVKSKNPEDEIEMNASYAFDLKAETLKDIQKAAGVLGMPEAAFIGDGKSAYLQVLNVKNPTSHLYSMKIGNTDQTFRLVMKVEWLCKIFTADYHVELDFEKQFANFQNENIQYWMAMEFEDV